MTDLTQKDWTEQLSNVQNAIIIDVRTPHEFEEGAIPNAININILDAQTFVSGIEAFDKEKNYYLYCRSGGRSAQACYIMEQLGFKNTFNLLGGITDWNGKIV